MPLEQDAPASPTEDPSPQPSIPEAASREEAVQDLPDTICPVVGIGASAGGLDAITQMLEHLPVSTGMGFVLIQHLDPNHASILSELLASHTSMEVLQATQGTRVEPNHIYVIPPNAQMAIEKGVLVLSARSDVRGRHLPIDFFFSSLAADCKSRAIGVILSGAASDGTLGLEAIKGEGGITFAQDASAAFDSMPRNAIAAGVVDFVMPPAEIARELGTVSSHSYLGARKGEGTVTEGPVLQRVLSLLHSRTGVDFTHYKLPTISRRVSRRMALLHLESLKDYLEVLEQRPAELDTLLDDLLITVTEFFRDPETFDALEEKVFPTLVKDRDPEDTIRLWVPGCASGKEVYSLAICLVEYLEKVNLRFPIQIFGTDVSGRSIEIARAAKYPASISASVSPDRLQRYFNKVEGEYQVAGQIRELCIFSRQDLVRDPPLSRMDLISCRNLLIYLGPVLQRRAIAIFGYALEPRGCLLLGNSESLGSLADHFLVLDSKHKIFARNMQVARVEFDFPAQLHTHSSPRTQKALDAGAGGLLERMTDRIVLDAYAPCGVLLDSARHIVKFRGEVGPYLSPQAGDADLDVLRLVREEIVAPLRSALEEVQASDRSVRRDRVPLHQNGDSREVNLVIHPVAVPAADRHFLVLFENHSPAQSWRAGSSKGAGGSEKQEYERLALELSTTRSYMQRLVEELRSANEEAQSSNEELQSTNEELQTAKEELQSSNEELTTTNEEMQHRNRSLDEANSDLVNLLASMEVPILMLTRDLRIRRYTPIAEKILNLIPSDVGRPMLDLKPRIDVPDLHAMLISVIDSGKPLEQEVQDQDGCWHSLRVHPYRRAQGTVDGVVIQLLDIDALKRSVEELKYARDYAEAILGTVREPLITLDQELRIKSANRAFLETFNTSLEQIRDRKLYELDNGQWKLPGVSDLFAPLARGGEPAVRDVEIEQNFKRIGRRTFQLYARHLYRSRESGLILLAIEDVTDRKRAAEAKYRRLFEGAKDGILMVDAETGEIADANPFVSELFGYSREETVGKRFWDARPFAGIEAAKASFHRLREEGILRLNGVALEARDGRQVEVDIVANVYSEGLRSMAQFNLRDITERKRFEQQLQQTAQLESLGILAGGIAHDFNNLLAGILGNAGLALSDAPPNTPYQAALKDVVLAGQRAADLTRQMLAYAGKGRFIVHPVDLSELVRDVTSLVHSSIPKTVDLELDLAEDLPSVEADAGQLQQVIMNLVINGAEAVGEGSKGQVRIVTRAEAFKADRLRAKFAAAELSPGLYVSLKITDSGSGMDEKTQSHIFDPFFTTKFTGRGLGLASVQGIIRAHHGAIGVESTPGEGSTFEVILPAAPAAKRSTAPAPKPESLRGSGLILVVDDEEIVLRTTRAILERSGYQVLTALNGALGVQIVRDKKDDLDLVILDLTMPVMGGEQALAEMKALAPNMPVILSSGYDASQAISRFGENALAGFLQKPGTVTNLLETVKSVLDRARGGDRQQK